MQFFAFNLEKFTPDRIYLHRHRLWCLWQIWGMSEPCAFDDDFILIKITRFKCLSTSSSLLKAGWWLRIGHVGSSQWILHHDIQFTFCILILIILILMLTMDINALWGSCKGKLEIGFFHFWERNISGIFGDGWNERQSWKFYLKYLDAAKMRGKVGTLIRDEMNRLYVLHYYRLKEHHESFSHLLVPLAIIWTCWKIWYSRTMSS